MKPVGVGLVYFSELHSLFESDGPGISAVELEPEAIWEQVASGPENWRYRCSTGVLDKVAALPQAKLLHGVTHPIGGTADDPLGHWPLLRSMAARLQPAWVSEHLSFNRVARRGRVEQAGFLLPPSQTAAGVRVAARNIARYRRELGFPVAFETGVNYLCPRDEDLGDGQFIGAVAETADCGILLDLHNLWCNEANGRRALDDVLKDVPLERVWEIHLAGGMDYSGFWLDAHSGAVPSRLLDVASELIPRLPNLGAIIFEVMPEYLPGLGLDGVQREIERLQRLWTLRRPRIVSVSAEHGAAALWSPATAADDLQVAQWEISLTEALQGRPIANPQFSALAVDPGCRLLRGLIGDFRRASLAKILRLTTTCLLAALQPQEMEALLEGYFSACAPELSAGVEAERFARYLRSRTELLVRIPYLEEILAFEHALVQAAVRGVGSDISWSVDPTAVIAALRGGQCPRDLPAMRNSMRIEPGD